MYKVSVQIYDKVTKSTGKTLLEAFEKIKLKPPKIITGGVKITAEKDGKKVTKILDNSKVKRFALNPIFRKVWAKYMDSGL